MFTVYCYLVMHSATNIPLGQYDVTYIRELSSHAQFTPADLSAINLTYKSA